MRKQIIAVVCAVSCMGVLLTGCQKTPEKKSVVQKSTSAMLNKEKENKNKINELEASLKEAVKSTNDKNLKDAKVDTVGATKAPVYQTKNVDFTQDQADKFLSVVTEGAEFYKEDQAWTKSRYKEEIKVLKQAISANKCGDDPYMETGKTYNEVLDEYKKAYEKAPAGESTDKASRKFIKTVDKGEAIYGYIKKKDGTKRVIRICNNNYVASPLFPTQMAFVDLENTTSGAFVDYEGLFGDNKNAVKKDLTLSVDKAREKAEKMIADVGIEGFSWDGNSHIVCGDGALQQGEADANSQKKVEVPCGYSFTFTRKIDGIQISTPDDMKDLIQPMNLSSNSEEGNNSQEALDNQSDYVKKLDYEAINVIVNDKGVIVFEYNAPFKVEKALLDDAHVLSGKETVEAVATYIMNSNGDGDVKTNVKKISIAYQRVQEEGSDDTTLLVPVWIFTGDQISKYSYDEGGKTKNVVDKIENSYLWTLNAIDGSTIVTSNSLG